jgi:hypothetical protein
MFMRVFFTSGKMVSTSKSRFANDLPTIRVTIVQAHTPWALKKIVSFATFCFAPEADTQIPAPNNSV